MRKTIGYLLQILGWGGAAWLGLVGGSFSAIYLMGFIGTGGREAGGELALMLGITVAGAMVGIGLGRWGRRLVRQANAFKA